MFIPLWYFFVCRGASMAEQPQRMEQVKESSCHIFDLLSKLSEKTEQLIANQAQQLSPSTQASGNFFSSSSFQILFASFPHAAATAVTMEFRMLTREPIFFCCCSFCQHQGHTSSIPAANAAYCCIILKALVSNYSQESIICIYRLCFYINNQLVITMYYL